MYREDTIAAISTAPGIGGIGIIRISGEDAFNIAGEIFKGKKSFKEIASHTVNYGRIMNPEGGNAIDEVLLVKMKRPNTFTREDVVEINCHGSAAVLSQVLELVIRKGARPAEPGEFTQRAFLNGRIDLSQAEAVIDLINSKTKESSRAAVEQLEGRLSRVLKGIRTKLVELLAHIEVTVDYPEHDIEEITGERVYNEAIGSGEKLAELIRSFEKGRILREGLNVVIAGRPNVGKSSLLNELAGKNKAIVTDIPGTTRDIIEEYVNINGIPVKLTDTAGIRQTEDRVEMMGVERARGALEGADLVVVMLDAAEGMTGENRELLESVENKKVVVLLNKSDSVDEQVLDELEKKLSGMQVLRTSVLEGTGIEALEEYIARVFVKGEVSANNEVLLTNIRHKNLAEKALKSLRDACTAYEGGMPLDCLSIDIRNAVEYLGEITGESVSEDVMHEIFNRFCIGK